MLEELKNKTFASEAEEAAWWEANEDALAEEFERAGAEGRLGHGTALRRASMVAVTIDLDPVDVEKARTLAADQGVPYEKYLQKLVHRALDDAKSSPEAIAS